MIQEMLSVQEVASCLGVSTMTVYRLIEQRKITCVRVGRSIRVSREAFDEFLRRNTSESWQQ